MPPQKFATMLRIQACLQLSLDTEARKENMRPLRTLHPNNLALTAGTSASMFSSCSNIQTLSADSIIPAANENLNEKCSGVDLWYALDDSTSMSMSGMAKDATVQLFLLQNDNAELFFGLLNGVSSADGRNSFANIRMSFRILMCRMMRSSGKYKMTQ